MCHFSVARVIIVELPQMFIELKPHLPEDICKVKTDLKIILCRMKEKLFTQWCWVLFQQNVGTADECMETEF